MSLCLFCGCFTSPGATTTQPDGRGKLKLYIIFGQRQAESAPVALELIDEFAAQENEDWLCDRLDELREPGAGFDSVTSVEVEVQVTAILARTKEAVSSSTEGETLKLLVIFGQRHGQFPEALEVIDENAASKNSTWLWERLAALRAQAGHTTFASVEVSVPLALIRSRFLVTP